MLRQLEVEANLVGMEALAAVVEAVAYWADDFDNRYGYKKILVEQGRKGMVEMLEFLDSLPERYSYASAAEYVLGYEPAGNVVDEGEGKALSQWNQLRLDALGIAGTEREKDMDGGVRLRMERLMEEALEFVNLRHERALNTLGMRMRRVGVPLLRLPFGEESVDEVGEMEEGKAL